MSVAFSLNAFANGLLQILSWVTCERQKLQNVEVLELDTLSLQFMLCNFTSMDIGFQLVLFYFSTVCRVLFWF